MKIDLHCHTKKVKQGDPVSRTIPDNDLDYEKFIQSRIEKNVGVVAITNHNHFDDSQFQKIIDRANNRILILPGVELDIIDSKQQRHGCNLIVSKSKRELLNKFLSPFKGQENKFDMPLIDFIELAKKWKPILLIDSREKDKDFPNEDIDLIQYNSKKYNFFYAFEASNAKSASIVTNHDFKVIVGSDSNFWDKFDSEKLPEINNGIIEFEGLLAFLKSNYYYGMKITKEIPIDILPYDENGAWEKRQKFVLKSGVNVIVGPKASGKSVLLKSIKTELEKEHLTEIKYYSEEASDWNKFNEEKIELLLKEKLDIEEEFSILKDSLDEASKISFSNIKGKWDDLIIWINSERHKLYGKLENLSYGTHVWSEIIEKELEEKIQSFSEDLSAINSVNSILELDKYEFNTEDKTETKKHLFNIKNVIKQKIIKTYINCIKNKLINKTKDLFKKVISKKTNKSIKPSNLSLFDYWLVRKNLFDSIIKLSKIEEKKSEPIFVGEIIDALGKKKQIYINCFSFIYNSKYKKKYGSNIKMAKKELILKFFNSLQNIKDNFIKNETLQDIIDVKKIYLDEKQITSNQLIGYITFYTRDKIQQKPSSGEQNFLLLSNILNSVDSNYFILDEPEKSLDNKIVNDYIVEKIKLLQAQNKYIVLTTHSANIAINTHPKLIIYRQINSDSKITWMGDSVSGFLISENVEDKVCWRETSLSLLEGGKEALLSRKDYYFDGK